MPREGVKWNLRGGLSRIAKLTQCACALGEHDERHGEEIASEAEQPTGGQNVLTRRQFTWEFPNRAYVLHNRMGGALAWRNAMAHCLGHGMSLNKVRMCISFFPEKMGDMVHDNAQLCKV